MRGIVQPGPGERCKDFVDGWGELHAYRGHLRVTVSCLHSSSVVCHFTLHELASTEKTHEESHQTSRSREAELPAKRDAVRWRVTLICR